MAFNKASVSSIVPIARQLGVKDIRLSPVPGSKMDMIMNSIAPVEFNGLVANSPLNYTENSMTMDDHELCFVIEDAGNASDHLLDNANAKAITLAAEYLADKGEEVIGFVRNKVIPTLELLTDRTVTELGDRKLEGIRQYAIVPSRPAEALFTDYFQEIMESAAPRHNFWGIKNAFSVRRFWGPKPIEDLLVLLRTNHPAVNALVDKAVSQYGEEALQSAYDIFFNGNPTISRTVLSPSELRSDYRFEGERLFAILLATSLKEDPPTGINISYDEVMTYCSSVVAYCASSLDRFMKNYATRAEKKFLDIHREDYTSSKTVEFHVNDQAYAYWKDQGLTDAAILGSMLSDGNRDAAKILANLPRYEDEWRKQERITARAIETNTETAILNAVRYVIHQHAKSAMGDNYLPESGKIDKKLNEIFECLRPRKDEDIYKTIREAALCIFFPDQSVCVMLKAMDDITEENPGMDKRQAAGLAFIDLGVSWMLSQISVS